MTPSREQADELLEACRQLQDLCDEYDAPGYVVVKYDDIETVVTALRARLSSPMEALQKLIEWATIAHAKGPSVDFNTIENLGKAIDRAREYLAQPPSAPPEAGKVQEWKCAARPHGSNQTAGGNDPQECDWPICECDPYASKVLAALQEQGFELVKEKTFGR